MEIKGKIIQKLPPMSGTSKTGNNWNKQEYVLETFDSYPKKVHFDFFGERANQYQFEVGDIITLSFDIESREYMGRWYTSIRGWKGVKEDPNAAPVAPDATAAPAAAPNTNYNAAAGPAPAPPIDTNFEQGPAPADDLPF